MAIGTAAATAPPAKQGGKTEKDLVVVPFVRASRERTELVDDRTIALTAASQPIGPIDIPALGFLAHLVFEVRATGGTGTVAVAHEDAPFSVLNDIQVTDVNGNPIFGPKGGYHAFLSEKYGAYSYISDARLRPSFSAPSTAGNFSYTFRVPIQISGRDALGALANMNASQTYKVRYTVGPASGVFTTNPTTLPNVQVRISLETWTQPRGQSPYGDTQAQVPPGHGTTQYWSSATYVLGSGEQTVRLTRVGNLIRTFVAVLRTAGARSNANWPDPVRLEYDGTLVESLPRDWFRDRMAERYGYVGAANAANGLDTGVFVWDFHHDLDGKPGFEVRNGYLRTTQGTRLDLRGAIGAASQLTVLTNDIAVPAGAIVPDGA